MAVDRSVLHRQCRGPAPRGVVVQPAMSLSPPRRRRAATPDPAGAPQANPPAPPRRPAHRRLTEHDYQAVLKRFSSLRHNIPDSFEKLRRASSLMVECMVLDHSVFTLLILESQDVNAAEKPALHLYRQMQLAKSIAQGLKKEKLKILDPHGGMSRLASTITRLRKHKEPEDLTLLKRLLTEVDVATLLYEPLIDKLREQEDAMGNVIARAVGHMQRNGGIAQSAPADNGQAGPGRVQVRPVNQNASPAAVGAPQAQPQSAGPAAQHRVPSSHNAVLPVGFLARHVGHVQPGAAGPQSQPGGVGIRPPTVQHPVGVPRLQPPRVVPPSQQSSSVPEGILGNGPTRHVGHVQPGAAGPQSQPGGVGIRPPTVQHPVGVPRVQPPRVVPPSQQSSSVPEGILGNGPRGNNTQQAPKRRRDISPATAALAAIAPTRRPVQDSHHPSSSSQPDVDMPDANGERKKVVARRSIPPTGQHSPLALNPVNAVPSGPITPPVSQQPSQAPPLPKKAKVDVSLRADPLSPTLRRAQNAQIDRTRLSPEASAGPSTVPPLPPRPKVDISLRPDPVSPTRPQARNNTSTQEGSQNAGRPQSDPARRSPEQSPRPTAPPPIARKKVIALTIARDVVGPSASAVRNQVPSSDARQDNAGSPEPSPGPSGVPPAPRRPRVDMVLRPDPISPTIGVNRNVSMRRAASEDLPTTSAALDRSRRSPDPSPAPTRAPALSRRPMVSMTVARELDGSSSGGGGARARTQQHSTPTAPSTTQDRGRTSPEPSPRSTIPPAIPPRQMNSIIPGLRSPPPSSPRKTPPPLPRRK